MRLLEPFLEVITPKRVSGRIDQKGALRLPVSLLIDLKGELI